MYKYGPIITKLNIWHPQTFVPRDKIFEYTVSLPSLPSIRNSILLCQKVDSRILRKHTKSLLTVYSGILTECLVYGWYTLEYTGAPVVGTPILGTHYIVSCDAEVCGAERESSRMIQERMH